MQSASKKVASRYTGPLQRRDYHVRFNCNRRSPHRPHHYRTSNANLMAAAFADISKNPNHLSFWIRLCVSSPPDAASAHRELKPVQDRRNYVHPHQIFSQLRCIRSNLYHLARCCSVRHRALAGDIERQPPHRSTGVEKNMGFFKGINQCDEDSRYRQ